MSELSREQVEALAQWDSGAYSCDCPDACPTLPCQNERDDLYLTVAAMLDQARTEAWDRGYAAGKSNAMRRMSDEPNAPTSPNPYRLQNPTERNRT